MNLCTFFHVIPEKNRKIRAWEIHPFEMAFNVMFPCDYSSTVKSQKDHKRMLLLSYVPEAVNEGINLSVCGAQTSLLCASTNPGTSVHVHCHTTMASQWKDALCNEQFLFPSLPVKEHNATESNPLYWRRTRHLRSVL